MVFYLFLFLLFFFFKQKTAYEMRISDWSSDVCSSDLCVRRFAGRGDAQPRQQEHRCDAADREFVQCRCIHVEFPMLFLEWRGAATALLLCASPCPRLGSEMRESRHGFTSSGNFYRAQKGPLHLHEAGRARRDQLLTAIRYSMPSFLLLMTPKYCRSAERKSTR